MFKKNQRGKRVLSLILALMLIIGQIPLMAYAEVEEAKSLSLKEIESFLGDSLNYIYEEMPEPKFHSEWSIMTLARGRYEVEKDYYNKYYENISKYVKEKLEKNKNGKLDSTKSTEHSRLIIALSSIGANPRDIDGKDILQALSDLDYAAGQGINGTVFSLIALDTLNYEIPSVDESICIQTTREALVEEILDAELKKRGWAWGGDNPDVDITAMTIQALAPYYNENLQVKQAVDRALDWLSEVQEDNGAYKSWGSENACSCAQVVVALSELKFHGVDVDLNKFNKKDGSLIDALMSFAVEGGGFKHVEQERKPNAMATDQATYALVSYIRMMKGLNSLYNMTDYKESPNILTLDNDSEQVSLNIKYGGIKDGDKFVSQNVQFAVETDQGEIQEVLGNNEVLEDITDVIPSSPGQPNFPGRVFIMPLEEGENTIEVKVKLGDRILSDKITVHKENRSLEEFLDDTLSYMYRTTPDPIFGTGGGEWTILSLARGRYEVEDDYYNKYYENVKKAVKEKVKDGKLHRAKGTEHSRLILGLTAAGFDPRDIDGFNALEALADFNYVKKQGINGSIFALIAFDSGEYEIPTLAADSNGTQTTREILIEELLSREIEDTGGWSLIGAADVDITAMAIQALAPYYKEREDVKKSVDKALEWLSKVQRGDGSYFSWGANNAESTAQVIVALGELANYGVDIDMAKFTKNDNTVIDGLMEFSVYGGGFMHVKAGPDASGGSGIAGEINGMATDQGAYALVSYLRMQENLPSLYDMTDVDKSPGTGKYKDSEKIDKTKLKETIDRLEKLDLDNYTEQTSNQLKEALKEARIILTDEEASQKIVDEKIQTLLELENKLEKKPEEKPTEPEEKPTGPEEKYDGYIILSIDKDTINYPTTLKPVKVGFYKGESVWDVLKREMDQRGIAYEYEWTEKYGSVYVQWIDGDGEFDHGEGSGWMYNVNGWYPNYGASKYILKDGDVVQWRYTTDLGADLGEDLSKWPLPGEEDKEDEKEDPKDKEDLEANVPDKEVENLELKTILTSIKKSSNRAVDVLNGINKLNKLLSSEDFKKSSKLSNKDIENIFISLDKGYKKIESKKDKKEFNNKVLRTSELVLDLIDKKQNKVLEENLNLDLILNEDGSLNSNIIKLLGKIKAETINFKTEKVNLSANFIELAKDSGITKLNIETDTIKIKININNLENKDIRLKLEEGKEPSLIIEKEGKKLDKFNSLIKITIKSDKLNSNSIIENKDGENLGGLYNKESKSISFITKNLGKYIISSKQKTFKDLKSDWSKKEIEQLASKGFIKGRGKNTFKGKENITRAEFVTLINRILELEKGNEVEFKDVSRDKWYYDEINKAYSAGLVKGVGGNLFKPDENIKREEIAEILGNILKKLEYETIEEDVLNSFKDKNKISSWAIDNVSLLVKLDLLKGYAKNELRPKSLATREEAAVLIFRFYEFIVQNY